MPSFDQGFWRWLELENALNMGEEQQKLAQDLSQKVLELLAD